MEQLVADLVMMRAQYTAPDPALMTPANMLQVSLPKSVSGLDDFVPVYSTYDAYGIVRFDIEIDANGTPDTFKWRKNGGAYTTGVSVASTPTTLDDSVTVKWLATTGHTIGDKWSILIIPWVAIHLDDNGDRVITRHDGTTVAFENNPTFGDVAADSVTTTDLTVTNPINGDLLGDVVGDLTGNVTGNVAGDVTGNVTGNNTGGIQASLLALDPSTKTLGAGGAALDLTGLKPFVKLTGDAGGNSLTSITNGTSYQILIIEFMDALVTVTPTAVPGLHGRVNYKAETGDILLLFNDASLGGLGWTEIARVRAAGQQNYSITATVDGLTTGLIPAGTEYADITSSVNTKLCTLPVPVAGRKPIKLFCGANGYKLQSNDKATVKINNVADGAKVLAVTAGDILICEPISATEWYIWKLDNLGAPATAGVPA